MRERGWDGASRFVDKTLENYLHVGLIRLLFPRAVILHAVRDPMDTGFACYRQLFTSGNETLYDLADIAAEYGRYRGLMDHWARGPARPRRRCRLRGPGRRPGTQIRGAWSQGRRPRLGPGRPAVPRAGRGRRDRQRQPGAPADLREFRRSAGGATPTQLQPLIEALGQAGY